MAKITDPNPCAVETSRNSLRPWWTVFAAATLLLSNGCVVQRGDDYGSWIGRAEPTSLVRITKDPETVPLQNADRCLLLPVSGALSDSAAQLLQQDFFREACNYLPASVSLLPARARAATYAAAKNLYPDGITLDVQDACRLGAQLNFSYVLVVQVREYRPYHPQILTLRISLLEVATQRTRICMEAAFDAKQQQLITAMGDYLQERRARKYDNTSLEIMLRSPGEYTAFAASFCCQSLTASLANPVPNKEENTHEH